MTVNGRRVLITGAGGSLGMALALACARRGCSLILCDRDAAALERVAGQLPMGTTAHRAVLDITDRDAVRYLFEHLTTMGGAPELVIHNAALSSYGRFHEVPPAEWRQLLEVNLIGAMTITAHALPSMLARGAGHVVFISSLTGLCASPGLAAYAASKQALHGFAESLYLELRPKGIGVSVVCPSTLRSEIAGRMGIHLGPTASSADIQAWRARRAQLHARRGLPCEQVAARCLGAIARDRFFTVIGWDTYAAFLAKRLLGSWYWPILSGILRRP